MVDKTGSATPSRMKVLRLKFTLEDGTEEDRDYILDMVRNGLDSHAHAHMSKVEYRSAQTGQKKHYHRVAVHYVHHFKTRHDERSKKVFFKLRLKYPEIKWSA